MILSKLTSNILINELIDDINSCIKNMNLVEELNQSKDYNFNNLHEIYNNKLIELFELDNNLSSINIFIEDFTQQVSKMLIDEKQTFKLNDSKEQENKKRVFEFIIFIQNKLLNYKKIIISLNWILEKMGNAIEINENNKNEFHSLVDFNIERRFKKIREDIELSSNLLDSQNLFINEFEKLNLNDKKEILEKLLNSINFDSILEMHDIDEIIRISQMSTSINFLIKFIEVINKI
ncbi:hypothetical protein CG002_01770 [Mesoplasma florum]|uniref:hypothetical protein n=1 Tax=Mesoplasma florum TaxID=2151 RepID=UPI000D043549|nr:hypothetical protein [Mesoplasma florum]AVN58974.1 hypothetical protein CG009_01895 [Mesoplasma florum]AVN65089.1 hypothetical protein CG002_01770 [Mesoplasma florum]